MEKTILIHGSGHKADSWQKTISYLDHQEDILCPELQIIENTGHVVNEENPKALVERLNAFYTLHA